MAGIPIATNPTPIPITYGKVPPEGPKAVNVFFDFSVAQDYIVDLTRQQNQGALSQVQCLFIDNALNNQPIAIKVINTNQTISTAAGNQGYFPVVAGNSMQFEVTTSGNISANIQFINVTQPAFQWSATIAGPVIANPLPVSDVNLEALIVAGRFNTRAVQASLTETDRSGTITLGGTAQTLMAANANRRGFLLQNIDVNFPTEEIWYSTTGAAVIAGAGSFALSCYSGAGFPGGSVLQIPSGTGAVSIIATSTGHKFTCKEYT